MFHSAAVSLLFRETGCEPIGIDWSRNRDQVFDPKWEMPEEDAAAIVKVHWNTQRLKSSYANFCNTTSTRGKAVLNFGVNQNWERTPAEWR